MLIPSLRAVALALLIAGLGLWALQANWLGGWYLLVAIAVLGLIFDALWLVVTPFPTVRRQLPARFALGSEQTLRLDLENRATRPLKVELTEELPLQARATGLPWRGTLPARRPTSLKIPLSFHQRGPATLGRSWLSVHSVLRFWRRRKKLGQAQTTRVYPNYAPVLRLALLAIENRPEASAQLLQTFAGMSREFRQLRDFREGDALSQVDWKATARRQKFIAREYEEQRDQVILFLLDGGRRMRAEDDGLPQFDHALNALLLVSWLALREGDQVGVLSFGDSLRWLAPVKGPQSMPRLLEHLYDLHSSLTPSDYREAVEELMARQKRRAMVILLTNLRAERVGDLTESLGFLASRHHVLAASLREAAVESALAEPVASWSGTLAAAAAAHYLEGREQTLAALEQRGVRTLEATAAQFPLALAQRYLEAKKRGVI